MQEKDLSPKGVIFGRATGFVQNRLNIIVQNYRGRTLNRELALMNLKQHGVDGEAAEEMLGPVIPDLETIMRGDDNIELAKLNRREVIDIPSGRESVKGRRDGDPPGRRFK